MRRNAGFLTRTVLITGLAVIPACNKPQQSDQGPSNSNRPPAAAQSPAKPAEAQPGPSKPVQPEGGTIEIKSTPAGAAVLLISEDEAGAGMPQPRGSTPATLAGVAPGKYAVHLEKPGYRFFQKEVQVKQNQTVRIDATLKKQ